MEWKKTMYNIDIDKTQCREMPDGFLSLGVWQTQHHRKNISAVLSLVYYGILHVFLNSLSN